MSFKRTWCITKSKWHNTALIETTWGDKWQLFTGWMDPSPLTRNLRQGLEWKTTFSKSNQVSHQPLARGRCPLLLLHSLGGKHSLWPPSSFVTSTTGKDKELDVSFTFPFCFIIMLSLRSASRLPSKGSTSFNFVLYQMCVSQLFTRKGINVLANCTATPAALQSHS